MQSQSPVLLNRNKAYDTNIKTKEDKNKFLILKSENNLRTNLHKKSSDLLVKSKSRSNSKITNLNSSPLIELKNLKNENKFKDNKEKKNFNQILSRINNTNTKQITIQLFNENVTSSKGTVHNYSSSQHTFNKNNFNSKNENKIIEKLDEGNSEIYILTNSDNNTCSTMDKRINYSPVVNLKNNRINTDSNINDGINKFSYQQLKNYLYDKKTTNYKQPNSNKKVNTNTRTNNNINNLNILNTPTLKSNLLLNKNKQTTNQKIIKNNINKISNNLVNYNNNQSIKKEENNSGNKNKNNLENLNLPLQPKNVNLNKNKTKINKLLKVDYLNLNIKRNLSKNQKGDTQNKIFKNKITTNSPNINSNTNSNKNSNKNLNDILANSPKINNYNSLFQLISTNLKEIKDLIKINPVVSTEKEFSNNNCDDDCNFDTQLLENNFEDNINMKFYIEDDYKMIKDYELDDSQEKIKRLIENNHNLINKNKRIIKSKKSKSLFITSAGNKNYNEIQNFNNSICNINNNFNNSFLFSSFNSEMYNNLVEDKDEIKINCEEYFELTQLQHLNNFKSVLTLDKTENTQFQYDDVIFKNMIDKNLAFQKKNKNKMENLENEDILLTENFDKTKTLNISVIDETLNIMKSEDNINIGQCCNNNIVKMPIYDIK